MISYVGLSCGGQYVSCVVCWCAVVCACLCLVLNLVSDSACCRVAIRIILCMCFAYLCVVLSFSDWLVCCSEHFRNTYLCCCSSVLLVQYFWISRAVLCSAALDTSYCCAVLCRLFRLHVFFMFGCHAVANMLVVLCVGELLFMCACVWFWVWWMHYWLQFVLPVSSPFGANMWFAVPSHLLRLNNHCCWTT